MFKQDEGKAWLTNKWGHDHSKGIWSHLQPQEALYESPHIKFFGCIYDKGPYTAPEKTEAIHHLPFLMTMKEL